MFSETIDLSGHIIDSFTLPKVLDQIVTRGATFNIVEFKIGQKRVDQSLARIEITAYGSRMTNPRSISSRPTTMKFMAWFPPFVAGTALSAPADARRAIP